LACLALAGNPLTSLPEELKSLSKLERITLPSQELGLPEELANCSVHQKAQDVLARYFKDFAK
jgi:hypothetical protein